jgi:CDGSH-type Zn-finger protein
MAPVVQEIKEKRVVPWCGCKRTGNQPFCDGSHARL